MPIKHLFDKIMVKLEPDTRALVNNYLSNIRFSFRLGIVFLLIFLIVGIILSLSLYNLFISGTNKSELFSNIPVPLAKLWIHLCKQLSFLYSFYFSALMLCVIWWGLLISCIGDAIFLLSRIIFKKLGLKRHREIQYFLIHKNFLSPLYSKIFIVTILIFIVGQVIIISGFGLNLKMSIAWAFDVIIPISFLVFIYAYVYDWRVIKASDPNLLKKVYGRKSILGDFFYMWIGILFLVSIFRFGLY